jgi:hypothetical protein
MIEAVYPNPASSYIIIEASINENANLDILNSLGQIVYSSGFTKHDKTKKIDVSAFSPGLYYLKMTTANKSEVQKILVQ